MKRTTFSILFIIKRTKTLRNGLAPIFVRITIDGERAEFSSHYSVQSELWDSSKGRVKGKSNSANLLNSELDSLKNQIFNKRKELVEGDLTITAQSLKNNYLGTNDERKTILDVFELHNERCKNLVGKDFAYATFERYETCKNHLLNFIEVKYRRKDMNIKEITPQFVRDFEYYLKVNRNCCNNTTVKYLKNFKKIVRIAIANRWMKYDPFADIRFKLDDVQIEALDQNELNVLCEKKFSTERLQTIKNIFLFSCFTGLAFVDVKNLEYGMIENQDGNYTIIMKRHKTNNEFFVPIIAPALQIIDKFKDNPDCRKTNKVLPVGDSAQTGPVIPRQSGPLFPR